MSEQDANGMLSVLMANGISVEKRYDGDDGVSLLVDEADLAPAIGILSENGFPRTERESIGSVFQKSGIMSSPFEERVRYIHALGEEVSGTLNEIDGVLMARVHVVLPEKPELGEVIVPSSAAVFIKHSKNVDLDFITPQIRRLVSNSIQGVEYDSVTVVLVEAEPPQIISGGQVRIPVTELVPGLGVRASDIDKFWGIAAVTATILALLVATNISAVFAFLRVRRTLKRQEAGEVNPAG
ncbi:Type III secretion component protein SctJ [Stappia aggregata IAM 12614]|uniref:Lipoprotein n=1 Tax=Roseibium aggregatum (strain ATCC 25650 / DSM 13394 / JCM 20685 / NBRC 16684 / NCIMB 2208 / IAM 12614 / B1) TaxID=384765 RepID=A0P0K7_ROSAI|nr:Type III secretion component protein SctJ [Stappia aggregata IAM 12614] [Roseibium aggregatum IAM 12614]